VRRCSADDPVGNLIRKQLLLMKNKDADFIRRLGRSELYSEFKQALGASTGLPLTLRPVEFWQLAHRGQPHENPFCTMIARTNRGCAACLEVEQRAVDEAQDRPAYAVGFQSLTHFNRMFRQLTGESPTRFRENTTSRAKSASRAKGTATNLSAWRSPTEALSTEAMRLAA
jgi:AraC-like DNA-binding protein